MWLAYTHFQRRLVSMVCSIRFEQLSSRLSNCPANGRFSSWPELLRRLPISGHRSSCRLIDWYRMHCNHASISLRDCSKSGRVSRKTVHRRSLRKRRKSVLIHTHSCAYTFIYVCVRAYFNAPTGTDVLGDLKSVLEGLVTRAWRQ